MGRHLVRGLRPVVLTLLAGLAGGQQPFDPDRVLVTSADPAGWCSLREHTVGGVLTQEFLLESGPGSTVYAAGERVRDVVVDDAGLAVMWNGTAAPQLTILDPAAATFVHHTFAEWDTGATGHSGGIDRYLDLYFVTDQATAGGPASGIVCFDRAAGFAAQRFAVTEEYIDLTVGLDGQLYALTPTDEVDAYDPVSFAAGGRITLAGSGQQSLAVSAAGDLYTVTTGGDIERHDPGGALQATLPGGAGPLVDLDLHPDGRLLIGTEGGEVLLSDISLNGIAGSFAATSSPAYVSWIPGPCSCPQCGDCDGNGLVNVVDALTAAQIAASLVSPTPLQQGCCDPNTDGLVTVLDALRLAQASAGMPVALVCC